MSFILEAVRDKPIGLFAMDDTAPFQDYSGFNVTATMSTGTAGTSTALMAGANYSTVLGTTATPAVAVFPSSVFKQGHEDKPFSLEAWVYLIEKGTDGEIGILSNSGILDGLTINGTKVAFSTNYTASGSARCEFNCQAKRRVHLVGVHTYGKNSLYLDGVLVAEYEITEAQKVDTYVSAGGNLYSGYTTTSGDSIAVNGLAIYATALSAEQVARHYAMGNRHVSKDAVPAQFTGLRIPLSQDEADVFLEQTWTTEFDWNSAFLTDVVVVDDTLKPALVNGISKPGVWLDTFSLDAAGVTSIYGVNMMWEGDGAIIEASANGGTTWETVVRGKNLTGIAPGFNPTDKDLEIRISFPGGISDDPAFVDNLTVTGFKTGAAPFILNRTITLPGYIKNDYEPVELRDDWGTDLNGGTLTITADSSPDAIVPKTVEVWIKRQTTAAATFSANLTTGTTQYTNGVAGTGYPQGEWVVRHFVNAAGITGDITVGGNVQVGHVMIYPDAKAAADVKEIYDAYIGIPKLAVSEPAVLSITEPATSATIVAADWAISASG